MWNPPATFPRTGRGILFVDELTSAPPALQAIGYKLILDRSAGDIRLPDGWMVVAAGNAVSDRGVTFTMASPLVNRMTLISSEFERDGWLQYAATHDCEPVIMALIGDRPDLLHKFDKDTRPGSQFPSPRGWMAASDSLRLASSPAERVELLKGDLGDEAAIVMEGFLRVWETMPKLEMIYRDPEGAPVPEELNVQYCVTMGLAATMDAKTFKAGYTYLKRLGRNEFQTMAVKLAYARDKSIAQAAGFVEWAIANQSSFGRG